MRPTTMTSLIGGPGIRRSGGTLSILHRLNDGRYQHPSIRRCTGCEPIRTARRLTTMNLRRKSIALPLFAIALALAGCNSSQAEGPPVPAGISALSGDGQFANTGSSAANPLVVVVSDQNGNPLPNATVSWRVTGGGGTVADTTSTTDGSGLARTIYTAGARPGAASILATAGGLWTATFTIYIEASGS